MGCRIWELGLFGFKMVSGCKAMGRVFCDGFSFVYELRIMIYFGRRSVVNVSGFFYVMNAYHTW